MSSSKEYFTFIAEQLAPLDGIRFRAMMGEYIIYHNKKVIGGIYDDRLLVKNTPNAKILLPSAPLELPYPGAKEMILIENTDNSEYLCRLFEQL